ncbi:hypothetical protein DOTSEDRAFT_91168 [Dothistroma septosporum NZE10]|uniref:Uncharacterized protein n=1 Tax=Dothistroma septosporum (strain NZE10 / CBS 128990) TaxID=675120 RepID=N1PCN7_DOTSN|nr:hypothetical protein DOTSEDRAFT_91168 [Dothistroma septosporum NZE10]
MPFDKESGQIFREETVRVERRRCRCSPDKLRQGRKPPAHDTCHTNRSLQDMAVRTLLRNLQSLDEDTLRPVPLPILERLWSIIKHHLLDSVRLWQLFASVGGLGVFKMRSWSQSDSDCQYHGLKDSIKWATSTSIHWLTDLTLVELNCSIDDLMYINELRNLHNLVVQAGGNDRSHLSDSMLHEWAYSTRRYGTLSYLQTMFLAGQNITSWSLQYLDQFPSLDTFCAYRCRFGDYRDVDKTARQAGWSLGKSAGAFGHHAESIQRRSSQPLSNADSWLQLVCRYIEHRRSTEQLPFSELPHLGLSYGRTGKKSQTGEHFSAASGDCFCFERTPGDKLPKAETAMASTQQADVVPQGKLTAKRRKLKDGKSIDLSRHIFFDE